MVRMALRHRARGRSPGAPHARRARVGWSPGLGGVVRQGPVAGAGLLGAGVNGAGRRLAAELVQEDAEVALRPVLHGLAVYDAVDGDTAELDLAAGGRDTEDRPGVAAREAPACDDLV